MQVYFLFDFGRSARKSARSRTQGSRSLIRVSLGKESPGRSSQGELARALMSQGGVLVGKDPERGASGKPGRERNYWYTPQRA